MKVLLVVLMVYSAGTVQPESLPPRQSSSGQRGSLSGDRAYLLNHWFVEGKVVAMQGAPVAGAKVKVEPIVPVESRILSTNSEGEFETEYVLNGDLAKDFGVRITVTKKGFLRAHTTVGYGTSIKPRGILITLRDANQDPNLLRQDELLAAMAPRLRSLDDSDGLSVASTEDYTRGVREFLDRNHSEAALPYFSRVAKRDEGCTSCEAMLALAELDSGDWDTAYRDAAEATKQIAKGGKTGRAEPLLILGVMESWKGDPSSALTYLKEALDFAPQNALALQELGRNQGLLHSWSAAVESLQKALNAGAGPEARLLLAEVLLESDRFREADAQMNLYFDGRSAKDMPPRAQQLWARVQHEKEAESARINLESARNQPAEYFRATTQRLKEFQPAESQQDLPFVLRKVGENVEEFFYSFMNTTSVEEIHEKRIGFNHRQIVNNLKSNYLLVASTDSLKEYRTDSSGNAEGMGDASRGFMLTSGFASEPVYFHPKYQTGTTFQYLGQAIDNKRRLLLVGFAQSNDPSEALRGFDSGGAPVPVLVKGVAWIDPNTYQILRMKTDLLAPEPDVGLERLTTDISFREVQFKNLPKAIYLPHEVDVKLKYRNTTYENEHRYTRYRLFDVKTEPKELGHQFEREH